MPKFRTIPEIVDAEQLICGGGKLPAGIEESRGLFFIVTESGELARVWHEFWVITDKNGNKSVCKPNIFEQNYVSAENSCKVYHGSEVEQTCEVVE